jgi:protein phosphatase
LVRKTNQDSGYVSTSLLLVADGMGGAAAGDLASVAATRRMFQVTAAPVVGQEALAALSEAIMAANDQLAALIQADSDLEGMGTTICGGLFDGEQLNIAHIGDSRGYRLSDGTLTRLTRDHSYVQSLVDDGKLDEEAAMTHPHRSLLLRVLNGQEGIQPEIFTTEVKVGDRLMFCSDGLCGMVEDGAIKMGLERETLDLAMSTLVDFAHAAGGSDNITIVMADVVEVKPLATGATADRKSGKQTVVLPAEPLAQAVMEAPPSAAYKTVGMIGAAADRKWIPILAKLLASEGEPIDLTDQADPKAALPHQLTAIREKLRYSPTGRRSRTGVLLLVLAIILALGGVGSWAALSYVSKQYYVGEYDGVVAIYKGIEGSVAGFDTSRLYEATQISLDDLPYVYRDHVRGTIPMGAGGLDQARITVAELKDKAAQCRLLRAGRGPDEPTPVDGC